MSLDTIAAQSLAMSALFSLSLFCAQQSPQPQQQQPEDQPTSVLAQTVATQSPKQVAALQAKRINQTNQIAQLLFNPTTGAPDNKPNPYPTQSLNEKAVDTVFGAGGFAVDGTLIRYIKNFYFYLEFLTRIDHAAFYYMAAKQHTIDADAVLKQGGWRALIEQLKKIDAHITDTIHTAAIGDDAYQQAMAQAMPTLWSAVPGSDFWQHIPLTQDDLVYSRLWQLLTKFAIAKSFEQGQQMLKSLAQTNMRLFYFVPNMELTYYHRDFTYIRSSAELFRMNLDLQEVLRARYARDCIDWSEHAKEGTKPNDPVAIYNKARAFSQTGEFRAFNSAEQLHVQQFSTAAIPAPLKDFMKHPVAQLQLICFSMLKSVQASLHALFGEATIEKTVDVLGTDPFKTVRPQVIPFIAEDEPYLKDMAYVQHLFHLGATNDPDLAQKPPAQSTKAQPQKTPAVAKAPQKKSVKTTTPAQQKSSPAPALVPAQTQSAPPDELPAPPEQTVGVTPQSIAGWWSGSWQKDFKNWVTDRANTIASKAEDAWSHLKEAGNNIAGIATNAWNAVENSALATWNQMEGVGLLVSDNPKSAVEHFKKSQELYKAVVNNIKTINTDMLSLLQSLHKVAADATSILADSCAIVFNAITTDKELADSLAGVIESGIDTILDFGELVYVDIEAAFIPALIALPLSLQIVINQICFSTIEKAVDKNYSGWGTDVVGSLAFLGNTVMATVVNNITFLIVDRAVAGLQDAIKLAGYLTLAVTQIVIDQVSLQLYGIAQIAGDAKGNFQKAMDEVRDHKRFIANLANNALMIGLAVATDGAAVPALAMNIGMTVGTSGLSIVGGFQDDETQKRNKQEQRDMIDRYTQFVQNNEIVMANAQKTFEQEMRAKFNAQIINQERELGFYQNFLQGYLAQTQNQLSFYMGSFLAPQLEPQGDAHLRFADVGALYGFKTGTNDQTGVLNVNPSQGFALYSKGRNAFSQEIPVYPAVASGQQQQTRKFWFNQKETVIMAEPFEEVEVRFKGILVLKNFIVGLYLGGHTLDTAAIRKTKTADIDHAHLAKMIVYRLSDLERQPAVKVYEHEGRGWLDQPPGPLFTCGVWYRIKAHLTDNRLQYKLFKEGDSEPDWQTVAVQKTERKMLGFISSGASVEYQFITPTIAIERVEKVRPPVTWPTEEAREQASEQALNELLNPTIGSYQLRGAKQDMLKGNFVYSPVTDALKNSDGTQLQSIVLGSQASVAGVIKISNLGASPALLVDGATGQQKIIESDSVVMASLSSGQVYDRNGAYITTDHTLAHTYMQSRTTLSTALKSSIESQRKRIVESLNKPISFGVFTLSPVSTADFERGFFVYKLVSPDPLLQESGKAKKDTSGHEMYDYVVAVDKAGVVGVPLTDAIDQIQSVVTGNVYAKSSTTPVDQGYQTGAKAFDTYMRVYGARRPELDGLVNAAATFYTTAAKKGESTKERAAQAQTTVTVSASKPFTQKQTVQGPTVDDQLPHDSLLERTKQATAGQVAWGM
ncbi:MAG: hypothetical protein WCE21_01785 [Candidatus Babeliales bacterium]